MYTVTCPQSGVAVVVACACDQVDHDPVAAGAHHDRCQLNNMGSNVKCPPEAGCCPIDHDHEAAANACPGGHGDCPEPDSCMLHESVKAHHAAMAAALPQHKANVAAGRAEDVPHFAEVAQQPPDECPGGHCHKDLEDCTGCHPLIITAGVGAAVLRPVASA